MGMGMLVVMRSFASEGKERNGDGGVRVMMYVVMGYVVLVKMIKS
jgi:hypothetical protein